MRLTGKVILVTGAASGMGRVAAQMFTREGAKVIATDTVEAALTETVNGVRAAGGEIIGVPGSVSNAADVQAAVAAGVGNYGRLDVLYNNAGIMPAADTSVEATSEETFANVMDVNMKGVFLCCKYGIPEMLKNGGGSIINIASFVALIGCTVPQDAYTASKGAVLSLTKSLAVEYGRRGIRANAICPGPIETPLLRQLWTSESERDKRLNRIPLGRFGSRKTSSMPESFWHPTNQPGSPERLFSWTAASRSTISESKGKAHGRAYTN